MNRRDRYIEERVQETWRRAGQGDFGQLDWRLRQLMLGGHPIKVTLDSGAAASVCPPEAFPNEPQNPADPNLQFVFPERYKVKPVVLTEEGFLKQTQFSVADVNKILLSAAEVANRRHVLILNPEGEDSWIYDGEANQYMILSQEDGVYVQWLYVLHPLPLFCESGPDSCKSRDTHCGSC